ncbi:hypothetical protein EON63_09110 [archaeon]|nr:MAG: hypothetical protein EON63_09110 [archaeon]
MFGLCVYVRVAKYVYDLYIGYTPPPSFPPSRYSQWETDKRVYYYEVLFEFCDSVIASIESKKTGDNSVHTVITALQQAIPTLHLSHIADDNTSPSALTTPRTKEFLNSSSTKFLNSSKEFLNSAGRLGLADLSTRKGSVYQYPNIPIYFRQYLLDTLTAFDLDCNGYLTIKEIEALLAVINMPHLTVSHFFEEEVSVHVCVCVFAYMYGYVCVRCIFAWICMYM